MVGDVVESTTSVMNTYQEAEIASEKIDNLLAGTYIVYRDGGNNTVPVMCGQYDANALLKMATLKNEGLESFPIFNKKQIWEAENNIKQQISTQADNIQDLQEQYLLLKGTAYTDTSGTPCQVQNISDISPSDIIRILRIVPKNFDYFDYNIVNSYLGENEDEMEN